MRSLFTKKKLSRTILYSGFIVTGVLLFLAGATLALDQAIAVKSETSYVTGISTPGSTQIETTLNFTFDRRITLLFTSLNPILINVTLEGIGISEQYSFYPSVDGTTFTATYIGYNYLPVGGDSGFPLTIVITKPPVPSFTVNVTVTEQTGFPRFVDAPGYFIPAAISLLIGTTLLLQLAFRDVDKETLFRINPLLRDGGLIACSASLLSLIEVSFTSLQNPDLTTTFGMFLPVIVPLVYLAFRQELWLELKQNILTLLFFGIVEYGIIVSLDTFFTSLVSYEFGVWIIESPKWLELTLRFLVILTMASTGAFLVTVPLSQDFYLFLRLRKTKAFQVARFARKLEQLLQASDSIKDKQVFVKKIPSEQLEAMPPSWRSEPFIQFLQQLDFEIRQGHIVISRPDFGFFLLSMAQQEGGFNLMSKPLWVPNFCANKGCQIVLNGEIPFNACLVTKVKGYASQKFSPREIEILSIALFLRDGEQRELLNKIAEGTINVRFPEQCRSCPNLDFIREEGSGALPDRPEIEIN